MHSVLVLAQESLPALKTIRVLLPLGGPESTSTPGTVPTLGGLPFQRHVICISTAPTPKP